MKVVYFAWLRERVGVPEEEIAFPREVTTVGQALAYLAGQGENYAYAFEQPGLIRAALDRRHARAETPLGSAGEIAFFPPMTGG